jgi:mRNA deadenylase 3'-5' endonuclease subunit Ccr4
MEDWAKAAYANDSPEFPFLLAPDWLKKIKEDGYDSIFHPRSGEVIMLEPNKIKSAIGNRGTYDITDADITKAKGGAILKHTTLRNRRANQRVR